MQSDTRTKRVLGKHLGNMRDRNLNPGYVRQSEIVLGQFLEFCEKRGKKSALKIGTEEVKAYLALFRHKGAGYQRLIWNAIRMYLKFAENPLALSFRPRIQGAERFMVEWLETEQIVELFSAELPPREKVIVYCGLLAGLRRGEILRLTLSDVEHGMRTGWLPVKGKNCRPRQVPMHPRLSMAFEEYLEQTKAEPRASDPILPMSYPEFGWILIRLGKSLGYSVSSHKLRRSHARLVRQVADIEVVSSILGHSSIDMTKRYIGDRMPEMQRAIMALPIGSKSVQTLEQPAT